MYNAERMGTISVISSTPVMLMLVLSVIPESYCDHGLWEGHYVFDGALSRSKHRTVGARLVWAAIRR